MNLGKAGEVAAKKYLEQKGFVLTEANYRFDRAETDLIMKNDKNKIILFIEVKTKASNRFSEPEDSVTHTKAKQMLKSAEGFLSENEQYEEYEKRFDVVSLIYQRGKFEIKHFENIF